MGLPTYIDFGMLYGTIIVFMIRFRQLNNVLKLLIYYLIFLAINNTLAMILGLVFDFKNNSFLFHITTPVEYLLLCLPFYKSLEGRFSRMAVVISMPVFIVLSLIFSLYVDELNDNNTSARIMEALFVTTWIMLYFSQLSTTDRILSFSREPVFWVYTGLLFYFLGTLFLQGFLNYLVKLDMVLARRLYNLQLFFEYILFVTINIGVFCQIIFKPALRKSALPGIPKKTSGL